jgi:hypothetical protein
VTIEEQLKETLKSAMRNKDKALLNLVRMLKTKMMERTTKGGFSGEVDDALWVEVISVYEKSQKKALAQYEGLGEAGAEQATELAWEIEQLQQWLPTKASLEEVEGWVASVIFDLGGAEGLHAGRVIG